MNEVPQPRVHLQPLAVGPKKAFIARGFADSLIGAGAALWGLEGAEGDVACLCHLVMVPAGQTSGGPPVGVGVDLLPLRCTSRNTLSQHPAAAERRDCQMLLSLRQPHVACLLG